MEVKQEYCKRTQRYLGNDLRHFTMEKVRKDVLVVLVYY